MWKEFWAEVCKPSGSDEGPYEWAAIAAGHFFIGAFLGLAFAAWYVALCYFIVKEIKDFRRGGRLGDCLIDTGFVFLGAAYLPLAAGALMVLGITFYQIVRRV